MKNVQMQILPLRDALPAGQGFTLPVVIRVLPGQSEIVAQRPPLNLALVLDRSGSMSGRKLSLAKSAACNLVSNLNNRDRVAIIAFDSEVTCVAESAPVTDIEALHRKIGSIQTAGNTALHQGWVEGGLQVSQHLANDRLSRVILLTDGQANVGETVPATLATHAQGLAERGVSTTTMGIGDDYDEVLLEGMARSGDGNFYHIQSSAQFEQFFNLELMGLANLVGSKVRLHLNYRNGVTAQILNKLDRDTKANSSGGVLARLLGRPKVTSDDTLVLPNLISEVPVEIAAILTVERVAPSGPMSLLDLRLTWDDRKGKSEQEITENFALPVVTPAQLSDHPERPDVIEKVVLQEIAALKLEANERIRAGKFDSAGRRLQKARALVMESPQTPEMIAELGDLDYIQEFLERGQYAAASKHTYYQAHQRSHSKTDYSSGRDTR